MMTDWIILILIFAATFLFLGYLHHLEEQSAVERNQPKNFWEG